MFSLFILHAIGYHRRWSLVPLHFYSHPSTYSVFFYLFRDILWSCITYRTDYTISIIFGRSKCRIQSTLTKNYISILCIRCGKDREKKCPFLQFIYVYCLSVRNTKTHTHAHSGRERKSSNPLKCRINKCEWLIISMTDF